MNSSVIKIIYSIFAIFISTTVQSETPNQNIELQCHLDTNVELRISISLQNRLMNMSGLELPIEINERKIIHENRINGQLLSYVEVDRFSLDYKMFSSMMSSHGWVNGRCTKLTQSF